MLIGLPEVVFGGDCLVPSLEYPHVEQTSYLDRNHLILMPGDKLCALLE